MILNRPPPIAPPAPGNASLYTLDTYPDDDDDRNPLLSPATPSYGATFPRSPAPPSSAKIIFNATLKMGLIFALSSLVLGGTLWLALPTLEEADRPLLRIPKSFVQLQQLNGLLKKYRDIFPYRIFICYVVTYLFLQAFSLPGSMYMSILGGAVWGVPRALPLACCCVATGATLCYLISAALGPALLTLPKWKAVLDKWAHKIRENKENMISFLIVLRIAPLPPHWVVNVVCPHVGIGLLPFWFSTALGILGVSVIHTTIGSGLDEMTSADDFHLISLRNFLGLAAVVVGVMIPVGLRYWFRREVESVVEEEQDEQEESEAETSHLIPEAIASVNKHSSDSSDSDSDSDLILEAGPNIIVVKDNNASSSSSRL
ncbi:Transmembrane protein 41B [Psilocybe cubensis]|uniref:Transmembrane protein 41B n=2 Tax=Psilocybe cubensis TaxID=181762 RepID=A0ACB8H1D8_PSICU|nr:Transmembrane protein 41B [Psilocybe cubensis]KAH9481545.1 Transmembrane protein 41B [Psilocybe cubensis]